jgi:membrane protein implicated in regulation of membrane protease activity
MELWHIWMLAAVALFILEIFTPSFFFACLGVGCVMAGAGALVSGTGYALQWTLFAVGGGVSFAFLRPLMAKYIYRRSKEIKTNTDVLIGKTGRVTDAIDPAAGKGRAMVGGDDWRARTSNNQPLPAGTAVTVIGMDGITVIVEKTN